MEVPKEQKEQVNLSLSDQQIDKRIAQILPQETVSRLLMVPIRVEGDLLYVATVSPINLPGIDEVRLITGLKVRTIPVARPELERAISEQFSANQMSKQAIVDMTLQELGTARVIRRKSLRLTMRLLLI
jgi:type IV pilus assembly protein PilB